MAANGKHPKFVRSNYKSKVRVGLPWRKPHGIDSKQRVKLNAAGAIPQIGYQGKKSERHKHPRGAFETLVFNEKELRKVPKGMLVRLGGTVGEKKRKVLRKIAGELKLHVLN